jgi:hypothetical protein
MNNTIKNKLLTWLVVFLLVANAGTILFFWINRPERQQAPKGSPKDFLVQQLELDSSQLGAFGLLIEKHQSAARDLKKDIKSAKEDLFQLLKQPVIAEAQKKKTVEAITIKIQQLELLNLEHFQQVRALCNDKQKMKFDGLLDQLAGLMAEARPPKAGMQAPFSNREEGRPTPPPSTDDHHPVPPGTEGHHPTPPPGEGHPPPPPGHRPPPPGEGHPPPPPGGHPPQEGKRPLPPPDQQ